MESIINLSEPRGWHSRGYLPHFDAGQFSQSITLRLINTIPLKILNHWYEQLTNLSNRDLTHQIKLRVEKYLDHYQDNSLLKEPVIATMVEESLLYFDGDRYYLHAWAIMPNHLHVLMTVKNNWSLTAIIHSWKSFTAHKANTILARKGEFWHPDYFDRFIRNERHFRSVIRYIEQNPVKAKLCKDKSDWPWSSASIKREI